MTGALLPDGTDAVVLIEDTEEEGTEVLVKKIVKKGENVLLNLDAKRIFWRVAVKPGKPTFFGKKNNKLVFGLPGNPTSALVSFLQVVRPCLLKMMGHSDVFLDEREAVLEHTIKKEPGRCHFQRGIFLEKNGTLFAKSAGEQKSHMLDSFFRANCLIYLEKERELFEAGSRVKIQVLPWSR